MGGFPAMTRKKDLRKIPGVFLRLPIHSVKRGGGPESGRLCPVPSSRRVPDPAARHEYQEYRTMASQRIMKMLETHLPQHPKVKE